MRLQVRPRVRLALATREFTCGLALAPETEDRCLAMTHPRVCVRAAKGSVSSLDHHGGTRTLGYQKKNLKLINKTSMSLNESFCYIKRVYCLLIIGLV